MLLTLVRRLRNRLIGRMDLERLVGLGLQVGSGAYVAPEVLIDPIAAWLVTIGDGATIAPRVVILAHDASMKRHTGYARVAPVVIGAGAFVGAGSVILPGVTVGAGAVVGAGSVVTRDVPDGAVAVGSPARVIGTTAEFAARQRREVEARPVFADVDLSAPRGIPPERRREIVELLDGGSGYVP